MNCPFEPVLLVASFDSKGSCLAGWAFAVATESGRGIALGVALAVVDLAARQRVVDRGTHGVGREYVAVQSPEQTELDQLGLVVSDPSICQLLPTPAR